MPFTIVRNDITKIKTDAIVNAANTNLQMGGGVCGAIFKAAGAAKLQAACNAQAPIKTGEAVITPGFDLPAKYIIHTAGPVYHDGKRGEEGMLHDCYIHALMLAEENNCESVVFPLISSGIYNYPKTDAMRVAAQTIQDYLAEHEMDVYLAVSDKDAFTISQTLLGNIDSYINEHYVDKHQDIYLRQKLLSTDHATIYAEQELSMPAQVEADGLNNIIDGLDEPFSTTLLRLIDAKGKTDTEVYKRANIDRKLFSKIRTFKNYMPSKRTLLALTIALELTLNETENLLKQAGYALSPSQKFDVIIKYFIISGKYDIFEINEVLFHYDQPLLGG